MANITKRLRRIAFAAATPAMLTMLLHPVPAYADNLSPTLPLVAGSTSPSFQQCDPRIFMTNTLDGDSGVELKSLNLKTPGMLTFDPIGATYAGYTYNAMAYNPADDYLYAMKGFPETKDLLRIGADGVPYYFGTLSSLPNNIRVIAAEFDTAGYYYLMDENKDIYKYDLNNLSTPMAVGRSEDALFQDFGLYDGALWGIASRFVSGVGTYYKIVRVDTATLNVVVGNEILVPNEQHAYTSVFAAANGIYAYDTTGNTFVKIVNMASGDINQMRLQQLATGSGQLSGSDGAKCQTSPLGLPADIAVTKTSDQPAIIPGQPIIYMVKVENLGSWGATEIVLSDPVPAGVTAASWTCVPSSPEATCSPASGTGNLSALIDLPRAGLSVTYELTLQTDPALTGEIVNIASITVPVDYEDNPGNNIARSPAAVSSLELVKTGKWIDTNDNGAPEPGEPVEFTFTVSNGTVVDVTNVTISDPMVTNVTPASLPVLAAGQSAQLTGTYTLTAEDVLAEKVTNVATAHGMIDSSTIQSAEAKAEVRLPPPMPVLDTEKSSAFLDDLAPNKLPDVGERIEFTVTVRNLGNVSMTVLQPVDEGPTFNGVKGTGTMTAFSPEQQVVPRNEERVFVAYYYLSEADISNAAGLLDGVMNTVVTPALTPQDVALGRAPTEFPLPKPAVATLPGYAIDKSAQVGTVTRGQQVPYVIKVTPKDTFGPVTLADRPPQGFVLLPGSVRVDGQTYEPRVDGTRLIFDLDVQSEVRIDYVLVATGSVSLGRHRNMAQVFQAGGTSRPISRIASGEVDVVPDPIFDCGDVIGRVFDDRNRNGYQDDGEPGVPGARVVTLQGVAITTDEHGRFNVACADLPDGRIGSTYIMKLDARSLPTGYRILSENPRSVRLTAGKVQRINFATSVGRVVRLDVNDAAFRADEPALHPEWDSKLRQLVEMLEAEPSVLRLSYISAAADRGLAGRRLSQLKSTISRLWKERSNRYRLEIEARMTTRADQVVAGESLQQ